MHFGIVLWVLRHVRKSVHYGVFEFMFHLVNNDDANSSKHDFRTILHLILLQIL